MKGNKEGRTDMVWGLPTFHSNWTSVPTMKGGRETRRGKFRESVSRSRLVTPWKWGKGGTLCLCLVIPLHFLSQVCYLSRVLIIRLSHETFSWPITYDWSVQGLGSGLDGLGLQCRLGQNFQTSCGNHSASCSEGTEGIFPGNKTTGAWGWPLTSWFRGYESRYKPFFLIHLIFHLHFWVGMGWYGVMELIGGLHVGVWFISTQYI